MKQSVQSSVGMTSYLKEKIRRPEGKANRDPQKGDKKRRAGLGLARNNSLIIILDIFWVETAI